MELTLTADWVDRAGHDPHWKPVAHIEIGNWRAEIEKFLDNGYSWQVNSRIGMNMIGHGIEDDIADAKDAAEAAIRKHEERN